MPHDISMRLPETFRSNSPLHAAVAVCLFEVTLAFAYWNGMSFSQAEASPFWLPDTVLLCALLLSPPRWWWAILLSTLPVRLLLSDHSTLPSWFHVSTCGIDCAKAVLSAYLLRRYTADPIRFTSLRDFGVFVAVAVVGVPIVGALGGAAVRCALGFGFWTTFEQWVLGDALAGAVATPIAFCWIVQPLRAGFGLALRRWPESLTIACGLIVGTWLAFTPSSLALGFADARFYAPIPFMFWAALRFGMRGATAAMAILTAFTVHSALAARGPFGALEPGELAVNLQQFLLLRALPLYVVAILSEQKERADVSLREIMQRYREVVETQTNFVCHLAPDMTVTFVNIAYCRFLEKNRADVLGRNMLLLLPESTRRQVRDCLQSTAATREPRDWECDVPRRDAAPCSQHWTCHGIFRADGELDRFQIIGQDVSDRKYVEEANRNLRRASGLAALGELTAVIAHEINQPLSAILSNAEAGALLVDLPRPPLAEIRQIFADIRRDDLRADETIRRVRSLVQRREIRLRPTDINGTIADVLRLVASDAQRRRVRIIRDLDPALAPPARTPCLSSRCC